MVYIGNVLRNKGRDEGAAGDGGSVGIFLHKADIPVQGLDAHEFFQVLDIELNLGIQTGVPVRRIVGVVDGEAAVQLAKDALDVTVVRLDQGGIELLGVLLEAEIDFLERARAHGKGQAFIADERCREHLGLRRAGFQGILSVQVRRNADGGAIEIYTHKGKGLSGVKIAYGSAHTRSLGSGNNHRSHQHEGEPYFFEHPTKLRQKTQLYKRESMSITHLAGKTRTRKPTNL